MNKSHIANSQLPRLRRNSNDKAMLSGAIAPTLLRHTSHMSLGLIAIFSSALVDSLFVGYLGTAQLAGLALCASVIFFILAFGFGLGTGISAMVANRFGAGDLANQRSYLVCGLLLSSLFSILASVVAWLLLRWFLQTMNSDTAVVAYALDFCRVWLPAGWITCIMISVNHALRAVGRSWIPGLLMTTFAALNAILDAWFIFGFAFIPAMGIEGAAWASVLAAAWVVCMMIPILLKMGLLGLVPKFWAAFPSQSWHLLRISVSSIAIQSLYPLSFYLLLSIAGAHGAAAVAAIGVGLRMESMLLVGVTAHAIVFAVFFGQNLSAHNWQRLQQGLRYSNLFCAVWSWGICAALYFFADDLASLFSQDRPTAEVLADYLRFSAIGYYGYAVALVIANLCYACQRPIIASVIQSARFALLLIVAWLGNRWQGMEAFSLGIGLTNLVVGLAVLYLYPKFLGFKPSRMKQR